MPLPPISQDEIFYLLSNAEGNILDDTNLIYIDR